LTSQFGSFFIKNIFYLLIIYRPLSSIYQKFQK